MNNWSFVIQNRNNVCERKSSEKIVKMIIEYKPFLLLHSYNVHIDLCVNQKIKTTAKTKQISYVFTFTGYCTACGNG